MEQRNNQAPQGGTYEDEIMTNEENRFFVYLMLQIIEDSKTTEEAKEKIENALKNAQKSPLNDTLNK